MKPLGMLSVSLSSFSSLLSVPQMTAYHTEKGTAPRKTLIACQNKLFLIIVFIPGNLAHKSTHTIEHKRTDTQPHTHTHTHTHTHAHTRTHTHKTDRQIDRQSE